MKKIVLLLVAAIAFSTNAFADDEADLAEAMQGNDGSKILKYAKKMAKNGDVDGQAIAGIFLVKGLKGVKPDFKDGLRYLQMCVHNAKSTADQAGMCYWAMKTPFVGENKSQAELDKGVSYIWHAARLGYQEAVDTVVSSACRGRDYSCVELIHQKLAQCEEPCLNQ